MEPLYLQMRPLFSFNQEMITEVCNLLPLCPRCDFLRHNSAFHLPSYAALTVLQHFQFRLPFYLSSCTHTFPISSLVVVSNGSVIKSTALVQQVIRSENTAWAALSVSVMSSGQAKCQKGEIHGGCAASGVAESQQ